MDLSGAYLEFQLVGYKEPLPFPEYLHPKFKYKNDFWITREGECVHPKQMNDRHLVNTIGLIERTNGSLPLRYYQSNADNHILNGIARWPDKDCRGEGATARHRYESLWQDYRIYMLLKRELKLRRLEA